MLVMRLAKQESSDELNMPNLTQLIIAVKHLFTTRTKQCLA